MEKTLNQKNFDKLIRDINSVLFYLSNVEVTRCQQQGQECSLTEPVEIILTIIDVFKFRDQFEREWSEQQQMQSPSLRLHQQTSEDDHPKNKEIKMELSNLSSRRKHTLNVGDPNENQVLMTTESNAEMMSLQVGSTQMETPQHAQRQLAPNLILAP